MVTTKNLGIVNFHAIKPIQNNTSPINGWSNKCTKMTNASRIMENFKEPHKRVKFLEKYYLYTTYKGSKLSLDIDLYNHGNCLLWTINHWDMDEHTMAIFVTFSGCLFTAQ